MSCFDEIGQVRICALRLRDVGDAQEVSAGRRSHRVDSGDCVGHWVERARDMNDIGGVLEDEIRVALFSK